MKSWQEIQAKNEVSNASEKRRHEADKVELYGALDTQLERIMDRIGECDCQILIIDQKAIDHRKEVDFRLEVLNSFR